VTAIFTGSLSRPKLPLLKWLPDPTVLVEPQEEQLYRDAHPDLDIRVHPEGGRGFSYLLNEMVRRTLDGGDRYFVFTDDDVHAIRVRPDLRFPFVTCPREDAREVLETLAKKAEQLGLAQYAVSFAAHSWAATAPDTFPTGAWGVHVTDALAVREVGGYDERLAVFGDWEMSARLLSAGRAVARTNLVTFVHKMHSEQGGASAIYEDRERVREAAEMVAGRYPEAARVVEIEAHGLAEVRFNWRKLQP